MPALGNRRSGRRGRPAGPFLLVLIAAVLLLAAACSSPGKPAPAGPSATAASTGPAKTVVPPGTPAGAQLRWLIAAVAHLPISDAQVRAHFDAAFLAQASPAMLNQALQGRPASSWSRSRSVNRACWSLLSPPAVHSRGPGSGSPSTARA